MASKLQRITLIKTTGEWEILDEKIKELGKSNLRSYIRYETIKLSRRFEDCPDCEKRNIGLKESRQFYVSEDTINVLNAIQKRINKQPASIVNDFIIMPLLLR